MNPKNKKLLALTGAALALPSMTPASLQAQTAPEEIGVSYRYSKYSESDQSAQSNTTGQSVERFDIDINQFSLVAPLALAPRFSVNFDAGRETLSGASPWFVLEGDDGEPIQVLSGATIEETRNDFGLSTNYYADRFRIGGGIAYSNENDYESLSQSLTASVFFNNKNTTLDVGISRSDDEIEPTQDPAIDPGRILSDDKNNESFSIGFTQVVNKTLLVGGNYSISQYRGFLSDPYKLTSVAGNILRDSRPNTRDQISAEFRVRKFLPNVNAAVHADYRFYNNDWGVDSHTLTVAWYQNIGTWQLSARLRGYDQSAANFFQNFFTEERSDGYHSSDYRLSNYGAISAKISARKNFENLSLVATFEDYQSGGGLSSNDDVSPGLVDFQLFSVGIDYSF